MKEILSDPEKDMYNTAIAPVEGNKIRVEICRYQSNKTSYKFFYPNGSVMATRVWLPYQRYEYEFHFYGWGFLHNYVANRTIRKELKRMQKSTITLF